MDYDERHDNMSKEKKNKKASLSGKQRRFLRSLGHHLTPVVFIGREGLSKSVVKSIEDVLAARELIKVKLGSNCPVPKKEAAQSAAERTGSSLVQLIGKTILLFKENMDLKTDRRIKLP